MSAPQLTRHAIKRCRQRGILDRLETVALIKTPGEAIASVMHLDRCVNHIDFSSWTGVTPSQI